jgi:predicted MFS family arabinose efflux permease
MKTSRKESVLQGLANKLFIAAAVIIGATLLQPILNQVFGHSGQIVMWPVLLIGSVILIIGVVLLLVDNLKKARERNDVSDEIG